MNRWPAGFTLYEVLVVISIVSFLAGIVFGATGPIREQSRDTERQSDLRLVQTALELYKQKYGRYPERCANSQNWSGESGSNYACDTGNEYIIGLAPEFIPTLPRDPRPLGGDTGYMYTVNNDGSVYKFMSKNTVESEIVDFNHAFKSCDRTELSGVACEPAHSSFPFPTYRCDVGVCDTRYTSNQYNGNSLGPPNECFETDPQFQSSYAVWGGTATMDQAVFAGSDETSRMRARVYTERQTESIVCRM